MSLFLATPRNVKDILHNPYPYFTHTHKKGNLQNSSKQSRIFFSFLYRGQNPELPHCNETNLRSLHSLAILSLIVYFSIPLPSNNITTEYHTLMIRQILKNSSTCRHNDANQHKRIIKKYHRYNRNVTYLEDMKDSINRFSRQLSNSRVDCSGIRQLTLCQLGYGRIYLCTTELLKVKQDGRRVQVDGRMELLEFSRSQVHTSVMQHVVQRD